MRLVDVYDAPSGRAILYSLLLERTPEQSISHKCMPSWDEHKAFVDSLPYANWYLIQVGEGLSAQYVGSIYLTHQREVGIFMFRQHQGMGYGPKAISLLRERHPGRLLANVNPMNAPSIAMFAAMGGKVIQHTYAIE